MLHDEPEHAALFEPRSKSRIKRLVTPCSLLLNAILFVGMLVVLSNPCGFSARKCDYKRDDIGGLKLLSEEHGFVPECKSSRELSMHP